MLNSQDVDIDMDAPQISTLREEDSPPPPTTQGRVSKFRVKLRVREEGATSAQSTSNSPQKPSRVANSDDEDEEDEVDEDEEEDQLADDDEDEVRSTAPLHSASISTTTSSNVAATSNVHVRSSSGTSKRGQGKGRGRGRGRPSNNSKASTVTQTLVHQPATAEPAPMMSWFEVAPSNGQDVKQSSSNNDNNNNNTNIIGIESGSVPNTAGPLPKGRKKGSKKKDKEKDVIPQKPGKKLKISKVILQVQEDPAEISEPFVGTAASSPVLRDINTPDFDGQTSEIGSTAAHPQNTTLLSQEEFTFDSTSGNVPLPIYPLPTKPFLVQGLPKIGTGFAPIIPLDKTGAKVRKWRQANREIRGIAGGRWFAKSWVGDKDSELASALGNMMTVAGSGTPGINTPVMSGSVSPDKGFGLSAPALSNKLLLGGSGGTSPGIQHFPVVPSYGPGSGRGRKPKPKIINVDNSGVGIGLGVGLAPTMIVPGSIPVPTQGGLGSGRSTAASSRSGSVVPGENVPGQGHGMVRAPSKMRTSIVAGDQVLDDADDDGEPEVEAIEDDRSRGGSNG